MTCSSCHKDARDNAAAYYNMGTQSTPIWTCWFCLSSTEKLARDQTLKDPRRFKIEKKIKEAV